MTLTVRGPPSSHTEPLSWVPFFIFGTVLSIDGRSGVLGIACFGARFRIGDVCEEP